MEHRAIEEKILTELAKILECELAELSISTELRKFPSWDSLAHISTITMLDTEFGVLLIEEEFQKIKTISDLIKFITEYKK